ncbi:MAG: ATP-binding protein, partial [Holophagales bacterium]|nr:ATP-binding protein [Holophagales bacterium]
ELVVERGGRRFEAALDWQRPISTQTLEVIVASAFPLLFWLAGTLASILVRPRDQRWAVLLSFYYCTALFFAAGAVSYTQQGGSFFVAHLGAAFFLPLIVHLHLILPRRFENPFARHLPAGLYALGSGLAAWDFWVQPMSPLVLTLVISVSILVALVILGIRLRLPAPTNIRVATRLMVAGTLLGIFPLALVLITLPLQPLENLPYGTDNLVVLGLVVLMLPNWPLSYLYAIYKLDSGRIRLRANRALSAYGFWSLFLSSYVVLFLAAARQWQMLREQPVLASLLFSFVFVAITPHLRRAFRRYVDHRVFGIHHEPQEILSHFAEHLPNGFDGGELRRTLESEVMPALMIRQSALFVFQRPEPHTSSSECELIYRQGVPRSSVPESRGEIEALARWVPGPMRSEEPRPGGSSRYSWIRLAIPLGNQSERVGMWLLGRRDPDDAYPREDVSLLTHLANQMASMVSTRLEQEENRRLYSQLVQSQKMEAIGRLSAGIAHDFNNLLSAILGYSDLLLGPGGRDEARARSFVMGIKDAGERAAQLTTQLLAFSRQQVITPEVVSLNDIVQRLEGLLRRVIEEDIELYTHLDPTAPHVCVDPRQMEQVLLNLVVNAKDAMPEGGTLGLSTRTERYGPEDAAPAGVAEGRWVVLAVKDSGTGIGAEIRDRIFDPFFTTKSVGKGTGQGLSIAYSVVVRKHGGTISVDSVPGEGSCFLIRLPLADPLGEREPAADEVGA